MKSTLFKFQSKKWISQDAQAAESAAQAELVLCFGGKKVFPIVDALSTLKEQFPKAQIIMNSTAGEIYQKSVLNNSLIAVALNFTQTKIEVSKVNIKDYNNSYDAAVQLVERLPKTDLTYIMVISDGSLVNGSELSKGLSAAAGDILVTGGLAGDDDNFQSTLVGLNGEPTEGNIVAVGFYGDKLKVTHGSQGGWEMFGLERKVTKSSANVLYEIDGENALDLYKKYLGSDAEMLPSSALLFPLALTTLQNPEPIVRTILSIDEENKSMTFAGDIPEGANVRLMKANFDKLVDASSQAASQTFLKDRMPDFSLLISCVGRKLILGPRIEEEVEAVADSFGNATVMAGFYSYGEISPNNPSGKCQLHNQTMTITSFYELS